MRATHRTAPEAWLCGNEVSVCPVPSRIDSTLDAHHLPESGVSFWNPFASVDTHPGWTLTTLKFWFSAWM